jgi:hypothetical protein
MANNKGVNEMEELKVIDEKGLRDVHVFRLCECDAVAAYSLDEALAWYKETTGLTDDELYSYDDIELVSPSLQVYEDENKDAMTTVQEIVNKYWNGKPFIALTTES